MRIYRPKNSSFYWYEFVFNRKRYHKSTRVKNERDARTIANAAYTALAKGEVGIVERKPAPTLKEYREDFLTAVRADKPDKPKTVSFYTYSFDSLLKFEPFAQARLDEIDEPLVRRFTVWALAQPVARNKQRTISIASVNRWRATLRKALRMALHDKVIQSVPSIPRLSGERERSFVFTQELRKKYAEVAPEPLNSVIQLSCENGICENEVIELCKSDLHMTDKADEWGHFGYLNIRKGKTPFRKRSLPITAEAKEILTAWAAKSNCELVFTRDDGETPISAYTLIQQQEKMRKDLNLPWDACIHSARHTALTNLGLTGVDPFTLQRAAGHADLSTTRKYVHPTPESMKAAFQKKVKGEIEDRRKATHKKKPGSLVIINPAAQLRAAADELRQAAGLGD